ncbi:hypothetical protein [Micromonospora sp. DT31]|uniref:hypothetical protein n=1 Tax=Micromonospora sp. DT31 TaxID=3393434 RepID=UPI003CF9D150
MTDRPNFLNDQPIEVQIDSLHAFAQAVQAELDTNVVPNASRLRAQLGGGPAQTKSFGIDDGYAQGYRIGDYHVECTEKAAELLDKLTLGMQAIAFAAQSVANDYANSDELNSMDLKRVESYFNPKDRSRSLAELGLPQPPANDASL